MNTTSSYDRPEGYWTFGIDGLRFYLPIDSQRVYDQSDKTHSQAPEVYMPPCVQELSKNRSVCSNDAGQRSLMLYESVPTFDSGDREWDSYKKLYLRPSADGKCVEAFWVRGGYHLASISHYSPVYWADAETESFIRSTGVFGNEYF